MQAFIHRRGYKTSKVHSGTTRARQRVILGKAWVDDRRSISNRARHKVNPGNTGRYQNTRKQPRQDYNNFRGLCTVAIARTYAIQYSAEGKRKSMVYVGCVMWDQLCD